MCATWLLVLTHLLAFFAGVGCYALYLRVNGRLSFDDGQD
jgi:hypothetical protein